VYDGTARGATGGGTGSGTGSETFANLGTATCPATAGQLCWVTDSDTCAGGGGSGALCRYDGSAWAETVLPSRYLRTGTANFSGLGANECPATDGQVCFVSDSDACVAGGGSGVLCLRDGGAWSPVAPSISGADIDPANITFVEDAGDSENDITAFAGDDLVLATTGVGDLDFNSGDEITLDAADLIVLTPGGAAGDDVRIEAGALGDFIFNGPVGQGWEFWVSGFFEIFSIKQGAAGVMAIDSDFVNIATSVPSFVFRRAVDNLAAGSAYMAYHVGAATEIGRVNHLGNHVGVPGATEGSSTGDGSPRALTIEPHEQSHQIDCLDPDTCDVTLGEANAVDGTEACFVNVSANVVDFADTPNVSELAGAFAAGQWDTLCVLYVTDRWVETSRSNN
jgi:hypothetical protein